MPEPTTVTTLVVGAGAAGLGCAAELAAAGESFRVWEASERAGGTVGTLERGPFRFESGPNTVPATAGHVRWLCEQLGIEDELVRSSDRARQRFLFHGGRLRPVPLKPPALLSTRLLSLRGKLSLLREPKRPFAFDVEGPEPSVHAFVAARFGPEAADRFAGAFVRGIYAGDAKRLGVRSAFPRLWSLTAEHGSVLGGMRAVARSSAAPSGDRGKLLSLRGGFGSIGRAAERVFRDSLRTNEPAVDVRPAGDHWIARSSTGRELRAERLVLAVPVRSAARLLAPFEPQVARELEGIRCASVHTLHFGFPSRAALALPEGFGFLVPPGAGPGAPRALGVIFAADLFDDRAPEGGATLTLIYGAETFSDVAHAEDRLAIGLEDLRRAGAAACEPAVFAEESWEQALPQYEIGHRERIEGLRERLRTRAGLRLAGNYLDGIGLDDTVASGRQAARPTA